MGFFSYKMPPQVQAILDTLLEPGESVVEAAMFQEVQQDKSVKFAERIRTFHLVLTDGYVRELDVVEPMFSKRKPWTLRSHKQTPLHQIGSVRVVDNSRLKGVFEEPHVSIEFAGPDGNHHLKSSGLPPLRLAQEFQRRVAASTAGSGGAGDQLARLADLRSQGLLTDDDWDRAKSLYLGKDETERERSIREIGQIHELYRSGVLSEGEFNMKKWDILARVH